MTIEEFVKKAKEQDSRNYFEPFEGDMFNIPPDIKEFYIRANPVDVEIRTKKFGNLHFFPLEEMEVIKKEYSFMPKDVFIFASTNGDPVFIRNSHYYITCESRFKPELLSEDFESFLDIIRIK